MARRSSGRSRADRAREKSQTSAWNLTDEKVEAALLTGERPSELDTLFGEAAHAELANLARQAAAQRRRGGPKVLILPNLFGSRLGRRLAPADDEPLSAAYHDITWLDPDDFAQGAVGDLALDHRRPAPLKPLGVFLPGYLKLKLSLTIAGYDPEFYPYDWRLDMRTLGHQLQRYLERLRPATGRSVSLVAHGMGGLVARAALHGTAGPRIHRLILLGTPNHGTFAAVQALRGVLPTVRQLAALDPSATPLDLARVLGGFVGFCQLLPASSSLEWDLFDSASWPTDHYAVQSAVLAQARELPLELAAPSVANPSHRQVFLIAGCNRRTVVDVRRLADSGAFIYLTSRQGDGTVPLESAHLDHAIPYFIDEHHGALPHHPAVLRAVQDILSQGDTDALDDSPPTSYGPDAESQLESALAAGEPFDGRRGSALRSAEIRSMLLPFVAPLEPVTLATPQALPRESFASAATPADAEAWSRLTVSRVRQHRLEIHLAQGSITDVDARAYVLGLFREVTPSGAAAAVDRQLDGAISDFTQRRMFGGHVGELFVLPAGRRQLRADMVVFAGLGSFDGFRDDVVRVTAENVARLMIRTHVENLATVLIGAGTGADVAGAVENMLRGFLQAIIDADVDQNFRRVTLCEVDAERYARIRQTLFRLAGTSLFDAVEVSFTELRPVPAPAVTFVAPEQKLRESITTAPEPVYLIVRQEKVDTRRVAFSSSLLPPTSKAAILSDSALVELSKLNQHLASLDSESLTFASLDSFGQGWTGAVLPPSIAAVLPKFQDRHLVVVHDADSSRLPWETMRLAKWTPARAAGLSHRYLADNLSVAKYLEQRRRDEQLHVLLMIDPTGTLPGAESEAELIAKLLQQHPGFRVDTLRGQAGTRQKVLKAISSGKYDVLHYAGHAFFNPTTRSESGILCAHDEVLSGADLSRAAHLPSLVFFNACESARVRQRRAKKSDADVDKLKQIQVGFAEAMMRGGVANYVGTYWPVADAAAETFGVSFYGDILAGKSLGDAVLRARRTLFDQGQLDWADYVHYGDHRFRVKLPPG